MSKQSAEHHEKAAEHHEHAARHHREAAKLETSGDQERAGHYAHIAHGHHLHATHHAEEAAKDHAGVHPLQKHKGDPGPPPSPRGPSQSGPPFGEPPERLPT
jgi:hypothetical protein